MLLLKVFTSDGSKEKGATARGLTYLQDGLAGVYGLLEYG